MSKGEGIASKMSKIVTSLAYIGMDTGAYHNGLHCRFV